MRVWPNEHIPDSKGWNWQAKIRHEARNSWESFALIYNRACQGAMILDTAPVKCVASQHQGQEAVTVEYLAAAPWNIARYMRELQRPPFLRNIGLDLMRIAVTMSMQRGHSGRLVLFAVPKARTFYAGPCHMVEMGGEPHGADDELFRFELTAEGAANLLEGS